MPPAAAATYGTGMLPQTVPQDSRAEPRAYVRGGFGAEMDHANEMAIGYFVTVVGWQRSWINPHEIVHLSGFFAFIALASSPTVRLGPAEAATGARATVARSLMAQGVRAEVLTAHIKSFHARLKEYSALWVGVLKGANSFGAFSARVFERVQIETRSRHGYVEHLNSFPAFCDRRVKAFHASTSRAWTP
jgi:hypothetical protein